MKKPTPLYLCSQCGHASPKWLGRCPDCGAWGTFSEEPVAPKRSSAAHAGPTVSPVPITALENDPQPRLESGIGELDRVLGGGLVPGSVTLVGGEPGIGKSTLMTQLAARMAAGGAPVLYFSGEESPRQIRLRAERLGALSKSFLLSPETEVPRVAGAIETSAPLIAVADSIQTLRDPGLASAPGTVSQVRDCAAQLALAARQSGTALFLIGHVTKEGTLAGPKVVEHLVDCVLLFEGERPHSHRILRAAKNRFGSTDEIGVFEMGEEGLREVPNPSAALLEERTLEAPGAAIACSMEGSRPLLAEVQALVTRSHLPSPRRTATGFDLNRLHMLLAVLEKRAGLRLGEQDVYLNVTGGLRLTDPATDLAVCLAVASSFREEPVDPKAVLIGEVGLGGEVRSVPHLDRRLKEAERLGFGRAIVPARRGFVGNGAGLKVVSAASVREATRAGLLSTEQRPHAS